MDISALWKALHTPGHDAASLVQTESGWRLEGMAAFAMAKRPIAVRYKLELAADWSVRNGTFKGFNPEGSFHRWIERRLGRWTLDGILQPDVGELVDLDFGFTPATNYPQMRRMALAVGESKRIDVAWLDLDSERLEPLPQIYRRLSATEVEYESPVHNYRAILTLADNGFVSLYPGLWECEHAERRIPIDLVNRDESDPIDHLPRHDHFVRRTLTGGEIRCDG